MENVWAARRAVHEGFRALEWYQYLRAMWIVSGELQELYPARPSGYSRSLEEETQGLVRQVALLQNITPEISDESRLEYQRWDDLYSARRADLKAGEGHVWRVFLDLTGEIADPSTRYRACEWVNVAAMRIWDDEGLSSGEPAWINNPNQAASGDSPVMLTLARIKYIIDEAAVAKEVDPIELKRRILS